MSKMLIEDSYGMLTECTDSEQCKYALVNGKLFCEDDYGMLTKLNVKEKLLTKHSQKIPKKIVENNTCI